MRMRIIIILCFGRRWMAICSFSVGGEPSRPSSIAIGRRPARARICVRAVGGARNLRGGMDVGLCDRAVLRLWGRGIVGTLGMGIWKHRVTKMGIAESRKWESPNHGNGNRGIMEMGITESRKWEWDSRSIRPILLSTAAPHTTAAHHTPPHHHTQTRQPKGGRESLLKIRQI